MSLELFKPTIWSNRLLANLHKQLVYGQSAIINTDYEGDIANEGDTVTINAIGNVAVKAYNKDNPLATPDQLTSAQTKLKIDQQDYFNFSVQDVDRVQSKPEIMEAAMVESAYSIAEAADRYIAGLYTDAGNTLGSDGSPVNLAAATPGDAYNALVNLRTLLQQANCPNMGRWVVVDPNFTARLLQDQRFVNYGTADNLRMAKEGMPPQASGYMGRCAGFDVYESNNVQTTGSGLKFKVIAGHPSGWSFADQISQVIAYRPELQFSDALKGLHLYGAKVVKPKCLAVATFTYS